MRKTLVLGDEEDDALAARVRQAIQAEGAEQADTWSAVLSHKHVTSLTYRIGNESLLLETETEVGISISGPEEIVDRIAAAARNKQ